VRGLGLENRLLTSIPSAAAVTR